jgi:nuclear pore complex protein Nup205
MELVIAGYGSETQFDINVRQRERLLRKSIIVYVGVASEFTGLFEF